MAANHAINSFQFHHYASMRNLTINRFSSAAYMRQVEPSSWSRLSAMARMIRHPNSTSSLTKQNCSLSFFSPQTEAGRDSQVRTTRHLDSARNPAKPKCALSLFSSQTEAGRVRQMKRSLYRQVPNNRIMFQNDVDLHRSVAKRLLDESVYPLGSFTPETWFEADESFRMWSIQRTVESVHVSFQLLERLLLERKLNTASQVQNHHWIACFPILLNNWRVVWWHGSLDSNHTPESVLARTLHYHKKLELPINEKIFYLIIEARMRHGEVNGIAEFAESTLEKCIELWKQENILECRPTTELFNKVIHSMSLSTREGSANRTEALLSRMLEYHIKINGRTYAAAIRAWSETCTPQGARRAQDLFQRMYDEYLQGDLDCQPTTLCFNLVISAWAKSGAPDAGVRADEVLTLMQKAQADNHLAGRVDAISMNATMLAHSNTKSQDGAMRVQSLLQSMTASAEQNPTYVSYLTSMKAWAQLGEVDKAETMLRQLHEAYLERQQHAFKPDVAMYTTLISALARSRLPNRVDKIRQWIQHMDALDDPSVRPNTVTYNTLLSCLANATDLSFSATLAEETLRDMQERASTGDTSIQPDHYSYTAVMRAWANAGDSDKAEEVFRQMLEDYEKHGNESAKPDLFSFNVVLSAFNNSPAVHAPIHALKFLESMESSSSEHRDHYHHRIQIVPDVYSYSTVLSCLSRSRMFRYEAAEKAEDLLRNMKRRYQNRLSKVQPNTISYNAVLNAWARANRPEMAESLLQQMYQDYQDGNEDAKPDAASFNSVLKAWALSKLPESVDRVEDIMKRMDALHSSGVLDVAPDVVSYTTLILCYDVSKPPHAPKRAEAILRKMTELYQAGVLKSPPNVKTYQRVRRIWASSNEPEREQRTRAIQHEMEIKFGGQNQAGRY